MKSGTSNLTAIRQTCLFCTSETYKTPSWIGVRITGILHFTEPANNDHLHT